MLRKRAFYGLLFPSRCPFCKSVIGFAAQCDKENCQKERVVAKRAEKTIDPAQHYLGELTGAASVYQYTGAPRKAIHRLKYQGMRNAAYPLGNIMAKELFGCTFTRKYGIVIPEKLQSMVPYHIIVPVPPSDGTRGYNVPSLLAQALQYGLGIPLREDVLLRVRFNKHQAGLPFAERFANAAGAFAAAPEIDLTGKSVLLVDDVITTGATVSACAGALYRAGAESVFAVSFAVASRAQYTEIAVPDCI